MFGCPYIIILVELCERVYETWNICLARKRQRNGAYQSGAYRSYARKTAYAPPKRSEKQIGNTTFIVNSFFREKGDEGIAVKLERLMKADVQKEATT